MPKFLLREKARGQVRVRVGFRVWEVNRNGH